jgi:hypothetical protein
VLYWNKLHRKGSDDERVIGPSVLIGLVQLQGLGWVNERVDWSN